MSAIYVVATADTKGEELAYVADLVSRRHERVVRVDVGTRAPAADVDVAAATVAAHHPEGAERVLGEGDRGRAVAAMGVAFARYLGSRDDVAGAIGLGGSGGTSIVCAGFRELPIGVPKVVVSTLASGDVSPYVDASDVVMVPAVTDLAGLNGLSRAVLHNAAVAVAAMAADRPPREGTAHPALGLTMFGVTTPCVTAIVGQLRGDFDCQAFHATGTGGRALERLVDAGRIAGVLDVTTTEVADRLCGGVMAASEDRLGAIARARVPYVGAPGALDMVNFGARATVPERYRGRLLHEHNPQVTLMRTSAEECAAIGRWIAARLNACDGPVRFLLPERGVSALDVAGGPFFDPAADEALFAALEAGVEATERRRVVRLPLHVNDPGFAAAAVEAFREIAGPAPRASAAP